MEPALVVASVAPDRTIFTVYDDGTLEIRGKGWDRLRRRRQPPGADNPRVCRLLDVERAKRIAAMVARMSCKLEGELTWV
jgi:hypothetical protein